MEAMKIEKAFTLLEPGPVVFVTTHDGNKNNIMTISLTRREKRGEPFTQLATGRS